MDCLSVPQGPGTRADGTPSRSRNDERSCKRGRLGSSSMLRNAVCSTQRIPEGTDRGREGSKNILLKDLNNDKSLLWLWESSPPQLSLQNSLVFSKEETNSCVHNKTTLFNNSESSFVLPDEEQNKTNHEPAYSC